MWVSTERSDDIFNPIVDILDIPASICGIDEGDLVDINDTDRKASTRPRNSVENWEDPYPNTDAYSIITRIFWMGEANREAYRQDQPRYLRVFFRNSTRT